MKKFYLFLDIDGVLWDYKYLKKEIDEGRVKKGGSINSLNPESINSLNYLVGKLNNLYDVKLVISSSWRYDMGRTVKVLKDSGLKYDKEIDKIGIDLESRAIQIKEYLRDKNNYDFLIIDDEVNDFKGVFDDNNIIKTDIMGGALSVDMVEKYFDKNNIKVSKR